MVKFNPAFALSILIILVLISGCLNSIEQPQKEKKIIKLDPQQLVLSDDEIKSVLGLEWKISSISLPEFNNIEMFERDFNKGMYNTGNINIKTFVSIDEAIKFYSNYREGNALELGDKGLIYSYDNKEMNSINIVFIKNNLIVFIQIITVDKYSVPNIDIVTAINLAKKQDAKISKILEIIK